MTFNYKHIKSRNFWLFLMIFTCVFANAQSKTIINGKVTENGLPIQNVNVWVEETSNKTLTDANGKFTVEASIGDKLLFSAEGYEPTSIDIMAPKNFFDVKMKKIGQELSFNVGYGKRNKTNLTAAISTMSGEPLEKTPVATITPSLQGQLTGLTVNRTSGDEPGWTLANFYVRGLGTFGSGRSPLFIIDGVERDITLLDPKEIESVTVLKDAAATVDYGVRAANGVLYITTKRGLSGKPQVSLNANFALQTPSRLPKYLGAKEYVRFRNIAYQNEGRAIPNSPAYNPDSYDGTNPLYSDTDWYKKFVGNTATQQMYNVSVTGGNEIVKYYVNLGVMNQRGLYLQTNTNKNFNTNTNYTRYNVRANTDINITKELKLSLDLAGSLETKNIPRTSTGDIFSLLSTLPPTQPISNPDGSIAGTSVYNTNPLGIFSKSGYEVQNRRALQGNAEASYDLGVITKGLGVNLMFAFDTNKYYGRGKSQTYSVSQLNSDGTYNVIGEDSDISLDFYSFDQGFMSQITLKGGFTYNNTFNGIHNVDGSVNYMQSSYTEQANYPAAKVQNVFGHAAYTFDNRYVAEFGFSYSGTEAFARGHRFGFFPVGSAAWILSNENFLKGNSSINYLKLRGSYGKVGNASIGVGRFPYMDQYYIGGGYTFGDGYTGSDGSYEGMLSNSAVTFESSLNGNIGIDAEFFNKRLAISADYFHNDRSDIITRRGDVIPGVLGQYTPYENRGSVLNQGFEIMLRHTNKVQKVEYYAQANISFAKNKITSKDEVAGQETWLYETGRSIDVVRGLEAVGFFNSQDEIDNWAKSTYGIPEVGDIKYVDQNNDGVIDSNDVIPFKYANVPEINFGLSLGAKYNGFDVNMLFSGVANRTLMITNNVFLGMQGNSKITATAYDTWQKGVNEATAKYPRLTNDVINHNSQGSTVWSHNGNYLRLQQLEFGYALPSKILAPAKISFARIYLNAYNLFTLDKLSKYNLSAQYPEAGVSTYPEVATYNIGIQLTF